MLQLVLSGKGKVMSIKEGLETVDAIVRRFNKGGVIDPAVYGPFDVAVMERAAKGSLLFEVPGCNERYDKDCSEVHMWFFGLMLCEYVAGLLGKKAKEGHCKEHRKEPELSRCPTMMKKHLEMLEGFRNALNGLVEETNEKITDLKRECGDASKGQSH